MRKVRGYHGKVPEVNFLHALLPLSPGSKAILELVPSGRKTVSHEASFQLFLLQEPARKTTRKGTAVYLALSMRALLPQHTLWKGPKGGFC